MTAIHRVLTSLFARRCRNCRATLTSGTCWVCRSHSGSQPPAPPQRLLLRVTKVQPDGPIYRRLANAVPHADWQDIYRVLTAGGLYWLSLGRRGTRLTVKLFDGRGYKPLFYEDAVTGYIDGTVRYNWPPGLLPKYDGDFELRDVEVIAHHLLTSNQPPMKYVDDRQELNELAAATAHAEQTEPVDAPEPSVSQQPAAALDRRSGPKVYRDAEKTTAQSHSNRPEAAETPKKPTVVCSRIRSDSVFCLGIPMPPAVWTTAFVVQPPDGSRYVLQVTGHDPDIQRTSLYDVTRPTHRLMAADLVEAGSALPFSLRADGEYTDGEAALIADCMLARLGVDAAASPKHWKVTSLCELGAYEKLRLAVTVPLRSVLSWARVYEVFVPRANGDRSYVLRLMHCQGTVHQTATLFDATDPPRQLWSVDLPGVPALPQQPAGDYSPEQARAIAEWLVHRVGMAADKKQPPDGPDGGAVFDPTSYTPTIDDVRLLSEQGKVKGLPSEAEFRYIVDADHLQWWLTVFVFGCGRVSAYFRLDHAREPVELWAARNPDTRSDWMPAYTPGMKITLPQARDIAAHMLAAVADKAAPLVAAKKAQLETARLAAAGQKFAVKAV